MWHARHFQPKREAILKEHFERQMLIVDICGTHRIHPNCFYQWKKELFENAVETFSRKHGKSSGPNPYLLRARRRAALTFSAAQRIFSHQVKKNSDLFHLEFRG